MIDVAFTRAEARPAGVAVVIDVLRATSTITWALAGGYRRVLAADAIGRAEGLRRPGRVLAGEHRCDRPPGFDLGNSPAGVAPPRGEDLVLATTNGAPAIVAAAEHAGEVLAGCLLNLDAVCAAIPAGEDLLLLCAGTDGRTGIDDVYVAGRIAARLPGARTDAALVAQAVARAHQCAGDALAAGAAARALKRAGLGADVAFCARESLTAIVPRVSGTADGVAVLTAFAPVEPVGSADAAASVHPRTEPRRISASTKTNS